VAHGLFAVFHGAIFTWYFREISRLGLPFTTPAYMLLAVGSGLFLAEILVALGFLANVAPLLYLVALLWFLFLATLMFIALVLPRPPGEPPAA